MTGHAGRPVRIRASHGARSHWDQIRERAGKTCRGSTLITFSDLGVVPEIADALDAVGITHPFPIQEMTLPIALLGADVIGQARTGTGKTLAFGVPLLQRIVSPLDRAAFADLAAPGKPQALVVVPTRELALQVAGDLKLAGAKIGARVLTVYGGRAYEPQIEALASGVEVVVGTPGRLLDLADQGRLDLGHVKVLVLDEADEMLDLGFLPDVEKLIGQTPENRQTMLFSATMPGAVVGLARQYLRQPTNIRGEAGHETAIVPQTVQHVFRAHALDKIEMIARILQAEDRGLVMIFCRTKRTAQNLADDLAERGFAAAAVHGDLGQAAREQALRAFRKGKIDTLVATDVAARGIDVEGVTHVINYQCPEDAKTYLHRIGRTGRAGASGVAVTFVDWDEQHRWSLINRELGLSFDEPMETYSTSEHLYDMLGIPAGVTGVLPTAAQTRAGLAAEEVEDLGETGARRTRTARRGDRRSRADRDGRSGPGGHADRDGRSGGGGRGRGGGRDGVDGQVDRRGRDTANGTESSAGNASDGKDPSRSVRDGVAVDPDGAGPGNDTGHEHGSRRRSRIRRDGAADRAPSTGRTRIRFRAGVPVNVEPADTTAAVAAPAGTNGSIQPARSTRRRRRTRAGQPSAES
jgi:superfamily II DNA/RNA helicase